jgi:hypothetical protein
MTEATKLQTHRRSERIVEQMDENEIWNAAKGYNLPGNMWKWPKFLQDAIRDEACMVVDGEAIAATERSLSHHSNFVRSK